MAKFDKLAKAFEEGKKRKSARPDDMTAIRYSMAVINAVEKLKRQGIKITKKAELDYLLARQHVERISKMEGRDLMQEYREILGEAAHPPQQVLTVTPDRAAGKTKTKKTPEKKETKEVAAAKKPKKSNTVKRNPTEHPQEFQKALHLSRQVVAEVEQLQKDGQPIPVAKMEEYTLCKRFLDKYT